jgi:hypothetical protein
MVTRNASALVTAIRRAVRFADVGEEYRKQEGAQGGAEFSASGGEAVAGSAHFGGEHLGEQGEGGAVGAQVHERVEQGEADEHQPQVGIGAAGELVAQREDAQGNGYDGESG